MNDVNELLCLLASTELDSCVTNTNAVKNTNTKNEESDDDDDDDESLLDQTINRCTHSFIIPINDNDNDAQAVNVQVLMANQDQASNWNLVPLKSKYSKQRIAHLLSLIIVNRIHYNLTIIDGDNDNDDGNNTDTDNNDISSDDTIQRLIAKLCSILVKAKIGLLDKTIASFLQAIHPTNESNDTDADAIAIAIAKCIQQAFTPHSQSQYWPVALSIIAKVKEVNPTSASSDQKDLLAIFLQQAIQKQFAPSNLITLSQHYIASLHSSQQISLLLSTLALKLKASPETSFETICSIVSFLNKNGDDNGVGVFLNGKEGNGMLVGIMKLLVHSKADMRILASQILGILGSFGNGGDDNDGNDATQIVMEVLHQAIMKHPKASVKFTTAEHRLGVYTAMGEIACSIATGIESETGNAKVSNVANLALEAIATSMVKETGKAKESGIRALMQWMALYKQSATATATATANDDNDKGYALAIKYLLQPILDLKPNSTAIGTEFRFRWGNLFAKMEYSMAERIVQNAFSSLKAGGAAAGAENKKYKQGLTTIVDASVKKHGNSNLVPQLDGLMAVQMLLVQSQAFCKGDGKAVLQGLPGSALKALLQGGAEYQSQGGKGSFLYSGAMMEAYSTDAIVQKLLHRCIASYTKMVAKARDQGVTPNECVPIVNVTVKGGMSAAAYALGSCIAQLPGTGDSNADCNGSSSEIVASVKTVLTYAFSKERAGDAIVAATFIRANELALNLDATGDVFDNIHSECIRGVAAHLMKSVTDAKHLTDALVLSHFGTTWMISADASVSLSAQEEEEEEEAREELENTCSDMISGIQIDVTESDIADRLIQSAACACTKDGEEDGIVISKAVHVSSLSLVTSLGKIAGTYDEELTDPEEEESKACIFAWKLCVKQLPEKIAAHLNSALVEAENFTADDIRLYNSPEGELYTLAARNSKESESRVYKNKLSEEEEWERQVKMELAEKKKNKDPVPSLSPEDKSKIEEQTAKRNTIRQVLDFNLSRGLLSVQALCLSDIEVGNSVIPAVSYPVTLAAISVAEALAMESKKCESFKTLCTLAECVYEIDEEHSKDLATALIMCQKKGVKEESTDQLNAVAFPAKCDEAQIAISEMEDYGDTLSGNSFAFLFPILRAALTGQRTTAGCEGALKVLERHAELISVDGPVAALRKDMGASVLELLSHDRSIAFKDPTPTETLVEIYTSGNKPTAAELAPLLSEAGALGNKNCRIAAMTTFAVIIETHPKLIKTNPVVENRILINCFAKDESIKSEACRAWKLAFGAQDTDVELPAPSKIYAIALVPLLSHSNADIANAAAAAFAFGIQKHPDLTDKSFSRLFNAYIDSYAAVPAGGSSLPEGSDLAAPVNPTSTSSAAAKPKKKTMKLDTGTVQKKPTKRKTGSAIASLTKTVATKKKAKPSSMSSFQPKKKERTLDQESLLSQFAPAAAVAQKAEEKDSEEKISIRSGVLQVLDALTGAKVELQVPTLKLLVGFLMAYGLADVNDKVRSTASSALRDTVASDSAKNSMNFLLPVLERTLKDGKADTSCLVDLPTEKVLDNTTATDHRKEGVVIALGSAAIHLRDVEDAEKINETFNMLINTLCTPSESVQASVALCLSKLMKKGNMKLQTEALLEVQIKECLHGQSLASRRGSSYGISAIVKGSGIATLKKFSVVKQLEEACIAGSASTKEGALFAIELLSDRLGLLFEPYVIVLLPALLKSFSDPSDHVRAAARNSVGLVMSKLSGHGVKLLVPAVLAGLQEDDWRTKQASIEMLGSMSHCAPKQLAR